MMGRGNINKEPQEGKEEREKGIWLRCGGSGYRVQLYRLLH